MDHQHSTDDIKGINEIIVNTVSETKTDDTFAMGDLEKDKEDSVSSLPFSQYKDTVNNQDSQTDMESNDTKSDIKNNPGLLKSEPKETLSEGDHVGSRRVSFYSDIGMQRQPYSRQGSQNIEAAGFIQQGPYLHPLYAGIPLAPNYRRISLLPFSCNGELPTSRKTSADAFYYPQAHYLPRPSQHGRVSVFSIGNSSDTGTIGSDGEERIPHLDHYRASVFDNQRPTLYQLREDEIRAKEPPKEMFTDELYDDTEAGELKNASVTVSGHKFGWIIGVLVRCLLNIFGVMLFLRLSWVTGQSGIGLATVIIALASTVTSITTMSMSAICTNGEVKGGGAYYMISRSLGPEFGGSIGVVFSIANAVGAAMYIVGFAETVRDIMWDHDAYITGDSINEVRIIGLATSCLCLAIVLIGMEWEAKAQLVLLAILSIALIDFFVGTFIPPDDEKKWKGVVGYNDETFSVNFGPHFTEGNSFFSVFAIFFPAATGVLAGANISGDLKNPSSAIPKGTFLAILLTSLVYVAIVWSIGGCAVLTAVGEILTPGMLMDPVTNATITPTLDLVQNCAAFNQSCKSGLLLDNGMVVIASAWKPLILAGIFSATLSSALASMVGAPKVFQALSKDKLFPFIHIFAKGYGPSEEPKRAYILCFAICSAMVCVGSLDIIAPIISNFFLTAYAMINFSCFDASMANSPGFRPGFKYYSKWLSLIGSLLCIAVMFLINWWAALVTFLIVAGLYFYVFRTKPEVNWGSSTQANAYKDALRSSLKLINVDDHVKNYRPQLLVLSGYPRNRANLVDFASTITKKQSLLVCGHVFQGDFEQHMTRVRSMSAYRWFENKKIKAFYNCVCAPTFRIGVQVLLQAVGVGKLRPNTLLLGYKNDWQKTDPLEVLDYFNVIQNKVPDNILDLDSPELFDSDEEPEDDDDETVEEPEKDVRKESNSIPSSVVERKDRNNKTNNIRLIRLQTLEEGVENAAFEDPHVSESKPTITPSLLSQDVPEKPPTNFRDKQYGTIDVWWLYDDGGLALLLPYILHKSKQWKHSKLRVFCQGTKKGDITEDRAKMASLLAKFRIEYSELTVVTELNKKPQLSTYREFESLVQQWRVKPGEFQEEFPLRIADTDLIEHKQKTYRHLRIREKLLEHSRDASLVVMTLPVPRKTSCPAGLYMGWLEILTKGLPPTLLLRGNQESVLTYYS
ncbi:solute carrier family 12 member 3-like [Ruditapes philippinarum]|uniref:solute carrier family 12 member 3-like n=1 Tax=Ruditapes philippinarum TaxID=129788 RepID=UPI00295B0247|nr:solute carrier family 12 member 3-like [Ruditapes philippinarum]